MTALTNPAPHQQPHTGPRQLAALAVIGNHMRAFGVPPTRAELGRSLGISKVSAHLLVKKLERDGLVQVVPRLHRNVCVAINTNKDAHDRN